MFYDDILSPDDKQKILQLMEWRIVEKTAQFLHASKHACSIRHTRTKFGRAENILDKVVPRVRASTINRLIRNIQHGQRGVALQQLSMLFELGLGVPLQREVAEYIRTYEDQYDKNGTGLKYIRKLVRNHLTVYRRAMGGWDFLMPAKYTVNMLALQSFITLKEGGFNKKIKVPDGIPVLLVYSNASYGDGTFGLVDAFSISPMGHAVPFAQIAMRKEFTAAPKEFTSNSLRGHGSYAMVFGILHWDSKPLSMARQLQSLDSDDYSVLLDDYREQYTTPELETLRAGLESLSDEYVQHKAILERLESKSNLSDKQKLAKKESSKFIRRRSNQILKIDELEKKLIQSMAKTGPVASAKFCALDIGTIADKDHFVPVRNPLDKIQKVLSKWGFATTKTVNTNCSTHLTYSESKGRCWSL